MLIALGVFTNFCFKGSEKAAAWAQAWGSLLAIAAAIWISNNERRQAQQREKVATLAIIIACGEFIQSIEAFLDKDFEKYPDLRAVEDDQDLESNRRKDISIFWAALGHRYKIPAYTKALAEIPLLRLESPIAVSALLELIFHISSPELFKNLVDAYFEDPKQNTEYLKLKADLEDYSVQEQKKNLADKAVALNFVNRNHLKKKLKIFQGHIKTIRDELGG